MIGPTWEIYLTVTLSKSVFSNLQLSQLIISQGVSWLKSKKLLKSRIFALHCSFLQVLNHAQNGTVVIRNWMHDSVKLGIRFDGDPPYGFGYKGTMSANVVWNCGGLQVKGDNHTIVNNLVFSRHAEPSSRGIGCTLCVPKYDRMFPDLINRHTITAHNAGDPHSINGGNWRGGHPPMKNSSVFPLPGPAYGNVQSVVRYEVRDWENFDFRPRWNSTYCQLVNGSTAGPYACDKLREFSYWIPGRQTYRASTPVPPDGCQTARQDMDVLMWLPALNVDTQQVVYGTAPPGADCSPIDFDANQQMFFSTTFSNVSNVFYFPEKLQVNTTYCWSVHSVLRSGANVGGDTWSFKTL